MWSIKTILKKIRRKRTRKAISNIGYAVLGFGIALAMILIGILVAGVIDDAMGDVFTQLNVSSTWNNLRTQAVNYASTGINISLVGVILAAVGILLSVVFGFIARSRGE